MKRLGLLIAALTGLPVITASQVATKVAPAPTFLNLSGVAFVSPEAGWVSGDGHALYRTSNAGLTWEVVEMPGYISEPFYSVYFATPQLGFVTGNVTDLYSDIFRTTDGGTSWKPIPNVPFGSWRQIEFVDSATGFMGTGGALLRSTDSGATWALRSGYPDCPIVYGMDLLNANVGLVSGYSLSSNQDGVFKTTDGGASWMIKRSGASNSVLYLSSTVALADQGTVMTRSTDGGETWFPIGEIPTGVSSMAKVAANSVVAVSTGGDVWRSTDGGFSWSLRYEGIGALPATWSVRFVDSDHGQVVGSGGVILTTSDGGVTWQHRNRGHGTIWYGLAAFSPVSVLSVGMHGYVQTSEDSGAHWKTKILDRPTFGRDTTFSDVALTGPDSAYVVGHWGSMFRTLDRGATWQNLSSSVNASYYANAVDFIDSTNGWVVGFDYETGPDHYVRKTTDGGLTWNPANLNVPSVDVDFVGTTGTGYILTTGPIYKTTDGGNTWVGSLIETPTGGPFTCTQMSWVSPSLGYVAGFDGFLAKTTDGGATWTRVRTAQADYVYLDVLALSTTEVWTCAATQGGGNAEVFRSVDGGATWKSWQIPGTHAVLAKLAAAGDTVYATGFQGETWRFDSNEVSPLWFELKRGALASGTASDLRFSDDRKLMAVLSGTRQAESSANLVLEVGGETTFGSASRIDVTVESSASRAGCLQRIYAFDFSSNTWQLLRSSKVMVGDTAITASIVTGAQRFLSEGKVKIRIEVDEARGAKRSIFAIDQIRWVIEP